MKVLHCINIFQQGGGAEKFLLDLATAENKNNGIEIKILSIGSIKDEGFMNIAHKAGVKIDILSKSDHSLLNFIKFWRYIRNNNIDVLHAHLFPTLYFATLCKLFQKKRPLLVYTEHSTNNRRRTRKIFKIIDGYFYRKYDCIFAISDKVKKTLELHVASLPITVINNGVDIANIGNIGATNIRKELHLQENTIILTMVSRFAWMKDYKTVFKSLKDLPTNVHLVCIGGGEGLEDNKRTVINENLENRVHFLGIRTDAVNIMKGSDIIILSTKYEGFSISMLEAMACHKPFVASDVPGLNDNAASVADFFKYQDPKDLANVLKRLIDDNQYYATVAERCYEFAAKHDINEVARKYIDKYKSMLVE